MNNAFSLTLRLTTAAGCSCRHVSRVAVLRKPFTEQCARGLSHIGLPPRDPKLRECDRPTSLLSRWIRSRDNPRREFSQNSPYLAKKERTRTRTARPRRPTNHVNVQARRDEAANNPQEKIWYSPPTLEGQPFSPSKLEHIYGNEAKVSSKLGNHILSMIQERRETGTLIDLGVVPEDRMYMATWPARLGEAALEWLRERYPMDEEIAAAQWADQEAERLEQEEYIKRSESLGLLKPRPKSASEHIKEEHERTRRAEEQEEREQREEEERMLKGRRETALEIQQPRRVRRRREADTTPRSQTQEEEGTPAVSKNVEWREYYKQQAQMLDSEEPPQMTMVSVA